MCVCAHVCMPTCVYVWCIYIICIWAYAYTYVCMYIERSENNIGYFTFSFSTLYFEIGLLIGAGTHWLAGLADQCTPEFFHLYSQSTGAADICITMPNFYMDAGLHTQILKLVQLTVYKRYPPRPRNFFLLTTLPEHIHYIFFYLSLVEGH